MKTVDELARSHSENYNGDDDAIEVAFESWKVGHASRDEEMRAKDAEIERLREALTFYANDGEYEYGCGCCARRIGEVVLDRGDKAQEALSIARGEG